MAITDNKNITAPIINVRGQRGGAPASVVGRDKVNPTDNPHSGHAPAGSNPRRSYPQRRHSILFALAKLTFDQHNRTKGRNKIKIGSFKLKLAIL